MSKFKLQLHDFKLVEKEYPKRADGKKIKYLRFSISWQVEFPDPNPDLPGSHVRIWGTKTEGNLAFCNFIDGSLAWHPPQVRKGMRYGNIMAISPDLYEEVKKAITDSPYFVEISPPKYEIWNNDEELPEPRKTRKPTRYTKFENESLNT